MKCYAVVYKGSKVTGHGDQDNYIELLTQEVYGSEPFPIYLDKGLALKQITTRYGGEILELELI